MMQGETNPGGPEHIQSAHMCGGYSSILEAMDYIRNCAACAKALSTLGMQQGMQIGCAIRGI